MNVRLVLGLFAAGFLGASCRQLADIEERAPCEGGATSACAACQRAHCCDALAACRGDAGCASAAACLAAADSDEDRSDCRQSYLTGFRDSLADLAACSASACAEACTPEWGLPMPSAGCGGCAEKCADAQVACARSSECIALAYCSWPCGDAHCRGDCERLHPEGIDAARALGGCLADECKQECAYPERPDWSCLDEPPQEVGEGPPVVVTLELKLFGMSAKPAGKKIRACEPNMGIDECKASVPDPGASSGGKLDLQVPYGFEGYFFTEDSPDAYGSIRYVERPITKTGMYPVTLIPKNTTKELPLVGTIDLDFGMMWFMAYDCSRAQPAGVSLALKPWGPETKAFYGNVGQVDGTTTTAATSVDETGGGFMNVPAGFVEVEAVRRDTMGCIARKKVLSHPGVLTGVQLRAAGKCP
ncbi:MAG: hypothetical protein HS104_39620 [Polyangiaceae bacterium]|nr:hypothetical protein [Polyangiaceae bacterium]MCL4756410.1 hypothetical protein [Myxococcales bacterium]